MIGGTAWVAPTAAVVAAASLVVAVIAQVITYRLSKRSWVENLEAGLKNQREAMRLQVREDARRDLADILGRWVRWLFDAIRFFRRRLLRHERHAIRPHLALAWDRSARSVLGFDSQAPHGFGRSGRRAR